MYDYMPWISLNPKHFLSKCELQIGTVLDKSKASICADDLLGHLVITGKTGTGKSMLIGNLVAEINRKRDCNVIIIDPHGRLGETCIFENEKKKLVYISPKIVEENEKEYCIQMNGIATGSYNDDPENRLGWIRELFSRESSISNNTWGPRLGVIFRIVLSEMVRQDKNSTLSGLAKILTNTASMKKLLKQSSDESARTVMEMQMKDWRNWNQYVSSTLNKLLPIISSRAVSALISSREDSLDLHDLIAQSNHMFVVDISKSSMPEDTSRILTSIFLERFWSEYLSLKHPIETYIIVDECQQVESDLLARMLSEGRKYGMRLVLATQSLSMLEQSRKNAILSNVRNFIAFNSSDDDARLLVSSISIGRKEKPLVFVLKNQKVHDAVIWAQGETGLSGPMSFRPIVQSNPVDDERVTAIIRDSIVEFGKPVHVAKEDEAEINRHAYLIDGMEEYLAGKGIPLVVGQSIRDLIPDGLFTVEGTEYILEAECSDLDSVHRIFRKIKSYSNRKIVFLSYPTDVSKLYSILTSSFKNRHRGNKILEVPLYRGDETIYFRDLGNFLARTYLVALDNSGLKYFDGKKMKKFSLAQLAGEGSFIDSLSGDSDPELRRIIYSKMVKDGTPYVTVEDVMSLKYLDGQKIRNFLDKIGVGQILTLQDIFTVSE